MLTNKEKRYLKSKAQKIKAIFQVGKDGVTPNMLMTVADSLEAHELIKLSVLKTCPDPIQQVALDLSSGTRSEIVQIIGRTVVLYRRSKKNLMEM